MADEHTIPALAARAQQHFSAQEFEKAVQCLQQMNEILVDKYDVRLQQNLRVATSAKAGFVNLEELQNELLELATRNLAGGELESKGEDARAPELQAVIEDNSGPETASLMFNLASLHFHQKQYHKARTILDALFLHIEPLEEGVAVQVCFLLLEVLLQIAQHSLYTEQQKELFSKQTTTVLNYLQQSNPFSASESDSQASPQSTNNVDQNARAMVHNIVVFRLHLYKCRVLTLLGQSKSAKKEIRSALEIFQRELRPIADEIANGSAQNLLKRARALLPLASLERQNCMALYLKANLEYLRQNYKKALKVLISCHRAETGGGHRLHEPEGDCYYNNLGCIYMKMSRYHVASLFFQRALHEMSPSSANAMPEVEPDGQLNHKFTGEILYNAGLSLLMSQKPLEAFHAFESAASLYRFRPHFWIRLAECCIVYHSQQWEAAVNRGLIAGSIATGRARRLVVRCPTDAGDVEDDNHHDAASPTHQNGHSEVKCTMQQAARFLANALYLIRKRAAVLDTGAPNQVQATFEGSSRSGLAQNSAGSPEASPSRHDTADAAGDDDAHAAGAEEMTALKLEALEEAVLLKQAYVHLVLADPLPAYASAQELLQQDHISARSKFLAQMYAAEASCLLGRAKEAEDILTPLHTHNPPLEELLHEQDGTTQPTATHTSFLARSINLAVSQAVQGQLEHARVTLEPALDVSPTHPVALRTMVYILLRQGKTMQAASILKHSRYPS